MAGNALSRRVEARADAFAAFLGRPFREADFYIGVTDGMRLLATEILCDSVKLQLADFRARLNLPSRSIA